MNSLSESMKFVTEQWNKVAGFVSEKTPSQIKSAGSAALNQVHSLATRVFVAPVTTYEEKCDSLAHSIVKLTPLCFAAERIDDVYSKIMTQDLGSKSIMQDLIKRSISALPLSLGIIALSSPMGITGLAIRIAAMYAVTVVPSSLLSNSRLKEFAIDSISGSIIIQSSFYAMNAIALIAFCTTATTAAYVLNNHFNHLHDGRTSLYNWVYDKIQSTKDYLNNKKST